MTVIMLSGSGRCGKTTTLNVLHDMLLSLGATSNEKERLGAEEHDFSDTVQYKNTNIKFYTMGDYSRAIQSEIDNYSANSAIDILIIACNTRFKLPYKKIRTVEHIIVDKTIESDPKYYASKNTSDAAHIMGLLQRNLS